MVSLFGFADPAAPQLTMAACLPRIPTESLSDAERLAELEAVVQAGLEHYVSVGRALGEIHDRELFRSTHDTRKGYLCDRWNLSESRGFSLIYSAQVADVLEQAGEAPQASEDALRELAPVLHQKGAQAAVEAFRAVADAGTLRPHRRPGSGSGRPGM
jgi:hypothetical protein